VNEAHPEQEWLKEEVEESQHLMEEALRAHEGLLKANEELQ